MENIVKTIQDSLLVFEKSIPELQRKLYSELLNEIKKLDTTGDKLSVSVKNLSILNSIKNKLNKIILNKEYKGQIKEFAKTFDEVYSLQSQYWKSIESTFKPTALLKAIRNQSVNDVVNQLTTQGISANVSDNIIGILRTNITSGGSYSALAEQLRQSLTNTPESKGILDKYVKTIAKDSINQFNRQYTQIVSSDLGYEWYRYMNSDIETTRCFCDAMTDKDYFHVSEIPKLLEGKGLKCDEEPVAIYEKTGLPYGMIEGTNADNFFVRAGGWNCGHSINPVAEKQVPAAIRESLYSTEDFKAWKSKTYIKQKDAPEVPVIKKTAPIIKKDTSIINQSNVVSTNIDKSVNELSDYSEKVPQDLTQAVIGYTGNAYLSINSYLRGQKKEIPDVFKEYIEKISKFINNAPRFKGVVYREIKLDNIEERDQLMSMIKSNKKIQDFGFVSTSSNIKSDFFTDREASNIKLIIETSKGIAVQKISLHSNEEEVLLDKGAVFKILEIYQDPITTKYTVKLKHL
jgi:hypothetical protein